MASLSFIAKTAYRDSRKNRGRLFLFMSSIVLGIAALVAINSFNDNVIDDIDRQAASLLGADLVSSGNQKLSASSQLIWDSIPGRKASEVEMASMAYLPRQDASQFVRIKALQGDFPFYGKLKTEPEDASKSFREGQRALVDDALLLQHGAEVGDSIKLGQATFTIVGKLLNAFGGSEMSSSFAPIVYIDQQHLQKTELVQPGSLVNYTNYSTTEKGFDAQQWKDKNRETFRNESIRIQTVEDRKEDLTEAFSSLNNFLNLVALVSLLLGCIGVASSVFIYVKSKIPSIAILRCLGLKGIQAFFVYFLQIVSLGIVGVLVGALLGAMIQWVLPIILEDFLPFQVDMQVSSTAVWEGIIMGTVITVLFALIPLLSIRGVSPLRVLRTDADEDNGRRDPMKWLVYCAILVALFLFLWQLTGHWKDGGLFTIGLGLAFLIITGFTKIIIWGVKRFLPRSWNFVFRQGFSNLFRPNNQTQTLLVSIGLGTAVLSTLYIIQGLILQNVDQMDAGGQPNVILFGIERDQKDELRQVTESYDLPIIQQVPIVTMKLEGWKGKSKSEWLADTSRTASRWAMNREARVTYRDTLDGYEKVLAGTFPRVSSSNSDSIFISVEEGWADAMDVTLNDQLVFNVQGTRITTYVGSLREIDWSKMRTRFFLVFPTKVLEDAPQFQVLVTKSPDTETTAKYRSDVVKSFPNVSVIDLGLILVTLNELLRKVSYVIQFMAAFSLLTGLIVLLSSLILSKFQRIQESVLLRTLGANRRQILMINATEYALIGFFSAATGMLIALIGSYLLAKFQLELDFTIQWTPLLILIIVVPLITVLIGLFNTRDVITKPPLEVLRKEV